MATNSLTSQKRHNLREWFFPPDVWISTVYNEHIAQPGSLFKYLKLNKERRLQRFSVSYFLSCRSDQQYYQQLAMLFWRTVLKFATQWKCLKNNEVEMDNFVFGTTHEMSCRQPDSHNICGTCAKLINILSILGHEPLWGRINNA